MPKNINNANEAMVALANALGALDVDAALTVQRVTEGWMQMPEEANAWRILTEAVISAIDEQQNT